MFIPVFVFIGYVLFLCFFSYLVFWLKWSRVLVTSQSSGPEDYTLCSFRGLESLDLALPLVEPKFFPKFVDENK